MVNVKIVLRGACLRCFDDTRHYAGIRQMIAMQPIHRAVLPHRHTLTAEEVIAGRDARAGLHLEVRADYQQSPRRICALHTSTIDILGVRCGVAHAAGDGDHAVGKRKFSLFDSPYMNDTVHITIGK